MSNENDITKTVEYQRFADLAKRILKAPSQKKQGKVSKPVKPGSASHAPVVSR